MAKGGPSKTRHYEPTANDDLRTILVLVEDDLEYAETLVAEMGAILDLATNALKKLDN
jgi:hypothetical protein